MTTNTDTTAASGAASQPEALRLADEAAKLAPILGSVVEGGATDGETDIYADDYSPPDGDVYVYRAADLIAEMAEELRQLHALTTAAPAAQETEPAWLAEVTGRLQSLAALKKRSDSMPVMHEIQWLISLRNRMAAAPRPQADAGAVAVPEGWRLVPVEPTPGMLSVGAYNVQCDYDSTIETIARHAYRVMVEAAPQAPAAPTAAAGAYAPLPKPYSAAAALGLDDLYTSDDMRAYADAHRAAPAPAAGAQDMESVLIDGVAYQTPAPVAAELLRLHLEAMEAPAAGAAPIGTITQPYTVAEIRKRVASGDYSAELMLQHALLHLGAGAAPTDAEIGQLFADETGFLMEQQPAAIADFARAVLARCGAAATAQEAAPLTQAARDVLAERRRQVEAEGWTPEHDDQYPPGTMARAAGCYATINTYPTPTMWPWAPEWWKPRDDRSNYVRASALLLAELERHDRAAARARQEGCAA